VLTHLEIVEPVAEVSRTLPAQVVDPVVAVRRSAELAHPPEEKWSRRVDVHGSEHDVSVFDQAITGIGGSAFIGG
jgi:hypothetical protein